MFSTGKYGLCITFVVGSETVKQYEIRHKWMERCLSVEVQEYGRTLRRKLLCLFPRRTNVLKKLPFFFLRIANGISESHTNECKPKFAHKRRLLKRSF